MSLPADIPRDPALNETEFLAVIQLLDDPDEHMAEVLVEKLRSYGAAVVPLLRHYLAAISNTRAQQTLEEVIHSFQNDALVELEELVRLAAADNRDIDLQEASMLISRFGYPETNREAISARLDEISLRVHVLFIQMQHPNDLNLLMCINRAFFEEERFRGAENEYYNPDNSYFHTLITRKRGIPISLAVLYILVADRAGVDLYGIGLPAHFVVFHPELNVFIDAYNNGAFLSENDCRRFVTDIGFEFERSMLQRVPNTYIVMRLLKNIIHAHSKRNEPWEAAALQQSLDRITEVLNET